MNFTRTAVVSLVAGLCLAPLAATPALAAPPSPSPGATASPSDSTQNVALDSVQIERDRLRTVARIRLEGAPDRAYAYVYDEGTGHYVESPLSYNGRISLPVDIDAGRLNVIDVNIVLGGGREATVPVTVDDTAFAFEAPAVSVVEHEQAGTADVTVTGKPGASVRIGGPNNYLQGGLLTTGTRTFTMDLPEKESTYRVWAALSGFETEETRVTLHAKATPPAAPTATVAATVGTRAVLDVKSEPGSVLRVTDTSGTLLAIHVTGTSGTAQALVPLPTKAGPVDVTAGRGDMTSAATPVDLPAGS